jgi:hypothetical protein
MLTELVASLEEVLDDVELHTLLLSDLSVSLPLHISLSRSLQVPTDRRQSFLEAVTQAIKGIRVKSFDVHLPKLVWAPNYDRTRWFLAAGAMAVGDELNSLLRACNKAAVGQGHGALYAKASERPTGTKEPPAQEPEDFSDYFHFSLAWSLKSAKDTVKLQQSLLNVFEQKKFDNVRDIKVNFDQVLVKIGNEVHTIGLGMRPDQRRAGSS